MSNGRLYEDEDFLGGSNVYFNGDSKFFMPQLLKAIHNYVKSWKIDSTGINLEKDLKVFKLEVSMTQ